MQKYIVLYKGPQTPPDASHEGWPEWFKGLGEKLIDRGSAMLNGTTLSGGPGEQSATNLNGYSIICAQDAAEAKSLLKDHPYLKLGSGYSIEMFEIN